MAHDLFLSHSSKDKAIADGVCAALEAAGIRCWIAPRDIRPGQEWPEAIVSAITASRVMVLIFSANSNNSKDVAKELTLAMNSKVIVIPFKIDDITPKGVLQYYLSDTHWLDAMNPPTARQVQQLLETVRPFIEGESAHPADPTGRDEAAGGTAPVTCAGFPAVTEPRWFWAGAALLAPWLAWAALVLCGYMAVGWWREPWQDPWYFNYLSFLALSFLLLIPAGYCLRRGLAADFPAGPAEGTALNWWWALPAFFGVAGGMIAWLKHRNTNRRKVVNMLILGIVLTPLWAIFLFASQAAPALSMSMIGFWQTSREANSVFVHGDTAYIANGADGLVLLDVSDPSRPRQIGSYPLQNTKNVVVAGNTAYVTEQGQLQDNRVSRDRLILIDVSIPATPRKLGEYTYEGSYIHWVFNNLAVDGQTVYLTTSKLLILVDVSTPSEPVTIGEFEFNSNISSPGVTVVDGIAYLQANRLHVVDTRNPAEPVEIGGFDLGWGSSIAVADKIAYIAGWDSGLSIIDVSTPSRPVKLGQYKEVVGDPKLLPPGVSPRQTYLDVSVSGVIAYVTYSYGVNHGTWTEILESGILAINVSDPGNPRKVDINPELDEITSIFTAGEFIYATASTRGLYIFSKR